MKLTVSVVQMNVVQSKPEENLSKGEAWVVEAAKRGSDIVCFPEMWTTGFNWSYNEKTADEHERSIERVAGIARRYGVWINGSLPALNEEGRISNTSILFNAQGERVGIYRKTHLFSFLHEDEYMAPGRSLCAVDTPWGPAGLAVCYDIRFPELFRTYALKGVKMVFLPAAFPHPRLQHWKILSRARAIENQTYLIGANQVGNEDVGPGGTVTYFGHSAIIDPWGETIGEADGEGETLITAEIDLSRVDQVRGMMRVLQDRRPDLYEL